MLLYAVGLGTGAYLIINNVEVNGKPYTAGNIIGIFFLVITASSNLGQMANSLRGIAAAKVGIAESLEIINR